MVPPRRVDLALPVLQTERLIVRLAERADRDTVLAYYANNRAHLEPFNPVWPSDFFTKGFWDRQIERNIEEYVSDQSVRFFAFDKSQPANAIANVSLGGILRGAAQFCYLGYGISEEKQGQGLMAEAVRAIVDHGFNELSLHRIMANYVPTNERSGNLLKRLGFTVEGYARDYLNLNGRWQDHILTSLTNADWNPAHK